MIFKRIYFILYFILLSTTLNAQYVGIGCMYDYNDSSLIFDMDYSGNISIKGIIPTGRGDRRVSISKDGLVLIANDVYFPPDLVSLSILKINDNGDVVKIRDIDLGGRALEVKITDDNKYALVFHGIVGDNPLNNIDYGISVFEINENDVITPAKSFFSMYNLFDLSEFDLTSYGLIIGYNVYNLHLLKLNGDGEITDTGKTFNIPNRSEIVITQDDKLALLACLSPDDLYVLNIDGDNVSYSGTSINTSGINANGIVVTPNSRVILQSLFGYVAVYDISETHNVTFRQEFSIYELAQSIGMTPDGNFAVVSYDFTPSHGKLSSFRIYPDGTVLELKKEATTPSGCVAIAFYQIPQTSVETDWQMYK